MLLQEMLHDTTPKAYRDDASDSSTLKYGDVRKTKLTLAQINLVRKMNDQRKIEYAQKLKEIKLQYGAAPAAPAA